MTPEQDEIEAIDRIARTPDGHLLHRYLRRVLEFCADFADSGALQAQNGRRTLARDLMGHMAQGIEDTSGRPGTDSILRRAAQPAGRSGSRAEQRRAAWAAERDAGTAAGSDSADAT